MTVSSSTSKVTYDGDGTTAVFAVPFLFNAKPDVAVIHADVSGTETMWTENTQYTLSGVGNPAGGTLTVKTAPTNYTPLSGERLTVKRVVLQTQETDYPEGGEFPAKAHEDALDKLTFITQQLNEEIGRSLTAPATDQSTSLEIPNEGARASKFLAFDGAGKPIAAAGTSSNLTPVSAFMDSLLDDSDAATARVTLGLDIGTDVQADLAVPSQAEAEAGVATTERVWTAQRVGQAIAALSGLPRSYLAGLGLSTGTDATNDIDIALGEARNATDDGDLVLASAVGKRIDASWAAGGTPASPTGGLSSSLTLANDTWYHVHLILVLGTVEIGFDTSVVAANLIADHGATKFRRIGSVRRGTATNLAFKQIGDWILWDDPLLGIDTTTMGTTAVLYNLGATVPPGVNVFLFGNYHWAAAAVASPYLSPPDVSDEAPSSTVAPLSLWSDIAGVGETAGGGGTVLVMTDQSQQVRGRASTTSVTFKLAVQGYLDRRGRDD